MCPGFRDHDTHGKGEVQTAHHEELQHIIQHRGIRSALRNDRKNLCHVLFGEEIRMHGLFTGEHLVRISFDRIDLTVVYDETVRVRPVPAGHGIRGKPGMDHGNGRFIILIFQIREEGAELPHQKHSLVDDGPAGKRRHIGIGTALLKFPADHIELPVKIQIRLGILRPLDKDLIDIRHALSGLGSEHIRVRLHFSPAKDL